MRRYSSAFITFGILSPAILGIFLLAYHAISATSFCRSCHDIEPYVSSWEAAAHSSVRCHEFPGPSGMVQSKARGISYVYAQLTSKGLSDVVTSGIVYERKNHIGQEKEYPTAPHLRDSRDHLNLRQGRPVYRVSPRNRPRR